MHRLPTEEKEKEKKNIKSQLEHIQRTELNTDQQWGPHLAPLQLIVQRTLAQVFNSLQITAQIAPSLGEHERRKRFAEFVIQTRRQLIKLLVLVKWSSNSNAIHKIMSIVSFLQRQNSQFDRTVNILRASKENFHSARMRNYDIPTALQVLTNRYPSLPGQLIDQFDTKPKLSDSQVIEIMRELDELIKYRLALNEVIPKQFRSYRIHDGRVFFKVDRMFECSLTLGGGQLDSRWFLLHVEFLFKVTGPRGKDFLPIPQDPIRNQIIECGNRVMAPSTLPTESDPDPKPPERPVMKVFAYLRDLCLNYQLEALHYQAGQLGRSAWAKHTRLSIPPDRSTLTILYWTHARPVTAPALRPGQPPREPPQPTPLGSITISRHIERHGQSRIRVLNFLNGYPSLPSASNQNGSSSDGQDDGDFGASCTERLQIIWRPIEVLSNAQTPARSPQEELESLQIREGIEVSFKKTEKGSIELELAMDELNLEEILQRVVRVHTDCILRRAFSDLTRSDRPIASSSTRSSIRPIPYFRSVRLVPWEKNARMGTRYASSIEIVLHARHAVELSIDEFSGRFRLQSVTVADRNPVGSIPTDPSTSIDHGLRADWLGGFNSVNMLRLSANAINSNPTGIRSVLARLKSDILLDQIELKARVLGIRTIRTLPILIQQIFPPPSLTTHPTSAANPPPSSSQSIMYCKLRNFSDHYLVIQVAESGIRCALILVDRQIHRPSSSHRSVWSLRQVDDLLLPSFVADSDDDGSPLDQFTLSRTQLQYVYHHCLIQATLDKLMDGMKKDGISYEQLLPVTRQMIERHRHRDPSSSTPAIARLPPLHPSFEVVGLLSIPLRGFLNPTLLDQNLFAGNNLAVKVFIQPNYHFGVQVEVRMKFDQKKITAEELERLIGSKQQSLNEEILAEYLAGARSEGAGGAGQGPAVAEEEDSDDEAPLVTRIQAGGKKYVPPQAVEPEEQLEVVGPDPALALDPTSVDHSDWAVDPILSQLIFAPRPSPPSPSLYPHSLQLFFALIRAPSLLPPSDLTLH